jgi:FkbM family methyltransferase
MVSFIDSPDFILGGKKFPKKKTQKFYYFIKGIFVGFIFKKFNGNFFTKLMNLLFNEKLKFNNNLYSKKIYLGYEINYPNKRITRLIGDEKVFFNNLYNSYLLDKTRLQNGDCFIDCGANIGELYFSLLCKNIETNYIAFEPDINVYNCLKKNVRNNSRIYQCALGFENKITDFYLDTDGANSSIVEIESNLITNVNQKKLDNYNLKNVKVLKVEAEGYELEVLMGSENTLKTTEFVTVDYGNEKGKNQESTVVGVVNYLVSKNFEFIADSNFRKVGLFRNKSFKI